MKNQKNSGISLFGKIAAILFLVTTFAFFSTACSMLNDLSATGTQTSVESTAADTTADVSQNESQAASVTESQNVQAKMIKVILYFPTEDNSAVKTEERDVQVAGGAILKACVLALLDGPRTQGLRNCIPEGTVLRSINLKDGVAIVDFSKEFATANDVAEITEKISVVNTLAGIQGVDRVSIRIEGRDWIAPSGMPYGEMEAVALDSNGFPTDTVNKTLTLYFANSNADKIIAEKRNVKVAQGEDVEKTIMNELIKGPAESGLYPTIPKGTKLISVKTQNGVCTLNLSSEFVDNSPGGTASESMTLNSVVDSLTELSYISKVQFLIEGRKRDVYTHAVFDKPFSRNEGIIG